MASIISPPLVAINQVKQVILEPHTVQHRMRLSNKISKTIMTFNSTLMKLIIMVHLKYRRSKNPRRRKLVVALISMTCSQVMLAQERSQILSQQDKQTYSHLIIWTICRTSNKNTKPILIHFHSEDKRLKSNLLISIQKSVSNHNRQSKQISFIST